MFHALGSRCDIRLYFRDRPFLVSSAAIVVPTAAITGRDGIGGAESIQCVKSYQNRIQESKWLSTIGIVHRLEN
jgi:hypothetical protein